MTTTTGLKEKRRRDGRPYAPKRWRVIVSTGHTVIDGKRKVVQTWSTFVGSRREALAHIGDLGGLARRGEIVKPTKQTLSEYLSSWHALSVEGRNRANTAKVYKVAIAHVAKDALGAMPLGRSVPRTWNTTSRRVASRPRCWSWSTPC